MRTDPSPASEPHSPTLSALIVAHNEERQLADCLETARFADEVVVVLDKCTDGSKAIAERFGAKLVEGNWDIEGERRNAGIAACAGPWVLEIDADERVTPELATEIRALLPHGSCGYYLVPFDNFIGSRRVRYGWGASWGVSAAPRLFRQGNKRWGLQRIHPSLELKGPEGRLENRMNHFVDKDISDMIIRLDRYTTAKAADMRETGTVGDFPNHVRRIFSRFWKCYVGRKGYREGYYGFLIALFAGLYPILSHLKAKLEPDRSD